MDELESKTNAWRAQGGLGLLSHTISVQKSQQSIPKVLILERRGRNREKKRRRAPGERAACCPFKRREREGEGVRGFLTPTTLNPKD